MSNLNKYSTTREFISLSFNKYNLYNLNVLNKGSFSKRKRRKRMTVYKRQLMAKQRLRKFYGNIREKQFFSLYQKASLYKGSPSNNLFNLLEKRLDVLVFRSGFAPSIYSSRQLISHGHILVNSKVVTISSCLITDGDLIQVNPNSIKIVKNLILQKLKSKFKRFLRKNLVIPSYLEVNFNTFSSILISSPSRKKIPHPIKFSRKLIDKFYNRS